MVNSIHKKLPKTVDIDDLKADAVFGLVSAVERFDPARGIKFNSFATYRIRGAIWDGIRERDWATRRQRKAEKSGTIDKVSVVSLSRKWFETDSQKEVTEIDMIAAKENGGISGVDFMDWFNHVCKEFSPMEKTLMRLYWVDGMLMREAANACGFSESRASQILGGIIKRLKAKITDENVV